MDIDAYADAHRAEWERLDALTRQRHLSGPHIDEFIDRYQSAASHLSAISTAAGDTAEGTALSVRLSRARLRFTGTRSNPLTALAQFVTVHLPAALYRTRWWSLAAGLAVIVVGVLTALSVTNDPRMLAALGSDAQLQQLVDHDFVNYYSENPAASFAGQVWTNNAWIAAQCLAFGITGLFVPVMLLQNGVNVGSSAGVMFAYGEGDTFFLYILPHGLLELTCVFVAAGAGMKLFWSWVAPGPRTRLVSLAAEGRALITVAVGLAFWLFVSGIVEGFVTPQPWPWPVKIGIGLCAFGLFLAYMLVLGGRAVRAGETGDLDEFEAGATQLTAG
ncbi:stage II sporulation protein M [Klugiella xanthotipulae]|uniref:Putative membrane protein SpoIIM required for sporulation n=1 Tax=Klugiella xanthotipulae TaxID=244735 RepID=A0A543HYI5_9MICO|nr:stage II sporulation protein M [Klugiella xanthotipulae]TQM63378.1 putative membrane protein SpoIIM required for sporulation [Klugiella xanthotipulae]